jgi:hypothetical protein
VCDVGLTCGDPCIAFCSTKCGSFRSKLLGIIWNHTLRNFPRRLQPLLGHLSTPEDFTSGHLDADANSSTGGCHIVAGLDMESHFDAAFKDRLNGPAKPGLQRCSGPIPTHLRHLPPVDIETLPIPQKIHGCQGPSGRLLIMSPSPGAGRGHFFTGLSRRAGLIAGGIDTTERIVERIGIAVITLAVVRGLHIQVSAEEAAYGRVVNTSTHMDNAFRVHHIVAGKAPIRGKGIGRGRRSQCCPVRISSVAEGIKAHAGDEVAVRIGDRLDAAQVIKMQVVFGAHTGGGFPQVIAPDIGFAGQAGATNFFEVTAARVMVGGGAAADGFDFLVGGAVDELSVANAGGFVEHIVLRSAAAEDSRIAVGKVSSGHHLFKVALQKLLKSVSIYDFPSWRDKIRDSGSLISYAHQKFLTPLPNGDLYLVVF